MNRMQSRPATDDVAALKRYRLLQPASSSAKRLASPSQHARLLDTADALLESSTLNDRWQILVDHLDPLGATQINYGIFDLWNNERSAAPVEFLSTMDSGWLDHYSSARLDLQDLHAALVRDGFVVPYRWGASGIDYLPDSGRQNVQTLSAEAGLRAALHVPLIDPLHPELPAGSFTLGSSLDESEFFAGIAEQQAELVTVAQLFHTLVLSEMRLGHLPGAGLSQRQKDCLSFVMDGLRIDAVAYELGLSRATVEMHLRNARQKLGAATLPEAVAKGLASGQLEIRS